jgi:hypothetical protein
MDRLAWERWSRGFGVLFVVVAIVAFILFGDQPKVGESGNSIVSFYDGDRGRILVGLVLYVGAFVLLAWFVGALVNALRVAGEGRLGATTLLLTGLAIGMQLVGAAIVGALSSTVARAGADDAELLRALNNLAWSVDAIAALPLGGAVLAASVGLNRSRLLPSWHVWFGVAAAILIVLRGTNWARDGFWAPSGDYAFITIIAALAWILVTSALLYRAPITEEPAARPAMAAG